MEFKDLNDKFGSQGRYLSIKSDTLPSKNRLGVMGEFIYVRGFYLDEVYSLSLIQQEGKVNFYEIATTLHNVIQIKEHTSVYDLEPVDLHYLLIVASMLSSTEELKWNFNWTCSCGEHNNKDILLSDIKYTDKENIAHLDVDGFRLTPYVVRDQKSIKLKKIFIEDEALQKNVEFVLGLIEGDPDHNYTKLLKNYKVIELIVSLYKNKIQIDIEPLTVHCSSCQKDSQLPLSIDTIASCL